MSRGRRGGRGRGKQHNNVVEQTPRAESSENITLGMAVPEYKIIEALRGKEPSYIMKSFEYSIFK